MKDKILEKIDKMYFGEKIQWLKLHGNLEKYNDYVDNYLIQKYFEEKIGDKYLILIL